MHIEWLEYTLNRFFFSLFHSNLPVFMAKPHPKVQADRGVGRPHPLPHQTPNISCLVHLPVKGHGLSLDLNTDPDLSVSKVLCFYGCSRPSCQHGKFCFHFLAIYENTPWKKKTQHKLHFIMYVEIFCLLWFHKLIQLATFFWDYRGSLLNSV